MHHIQHVHMYQMWEAYKKQITGAKKQVPQISVDSISILLSWAYILHKGGMERKRWCRSICRGLIIFSRHLKQMSNDVTLLSASLCLLVLVLCQLNVIVWTHKRSCGGGHVGFISHFVQIKGKFLNESVQGFCQCFTGLACKFSLK